MGILPLTPGLLISMAIRYDHSFGFHTGSLMMFSDGETLIDKQIKLIREAATCYHRLKGLYEAEWVSKSLAGTDLQLFEEMTGEGFYQPDREEGYCNAATIAALREAKQLAEDQVSFDGPAPVLTVLEANKPAVVYNWQPRTSDYNSMPEFLFYD